MKRLALLLLLGPGCAAAPLVTVAPYAHTPSALAVLPIGVGAEAPLPADRTPLVEAVKRAGVVVADEHAGKSRDIAVLSARISSVEEKVIVPPVGDLPFASGVTFEWVHYQVELRLSDGDGRELARAVGQVNDGARQRTELRALLRAMTTQMVAGLSTGAPVLARR